MTPRLARRLQYAAGAIVLLYLLTFVRGLGWQWRGILTATNAARTASR